jgi:hypothetical protein
MIYFIQSVQKRILYKFGLFFHFKNKFSKDDESAMLHPQLPPNSAPEPPNFDHCGTPISTFLAINADGFTTGIAVAF